MDQLKCESCGAPLEHDGHCSYCGARYKVDNNDRIVFMEYRPGVQKIVAQTAIPDWLRDLAMQKELGTMAQKEIAHSLAEHLGDMIKYTTSYDPVFQRTMIRGEVRVVEPDFRF